MGEISLRLDIKSAKKCWNLRFQDLSQCVEIGTAFRPATAGFLARTVLSIYLYKYIFIYGNVFIYVRVLPPLLADFLFGSLWLGL